MNESEFLNETLADEIKSENSRTAAARQAKKMGLVYAGFGRYLDSKGKVSYVVHDGKLVPYKGIEGVQKMYDKADNAATDEKYKELKSKADEHSRVYKTREKEDQKIFRSSRETYRRSTSLLTSYIHRICLTIRNQMLSTNTRTIFTIQSIVIYTKDMTKEQMQRKTATLQV